MKKLIRQNLSYFIPYFIFLGIAIPAILIYPKLELHLLTNSYHSGFADVFFKTITFLGDGTAPFIIAIPFLFFSFRKTLILLVAGNIAGIIAQLLKRMVFSDSKRPWAYFRETEGFHTVQGVDLHSSFSFPSGHSATVFALSICLATFVKHPLWKVLLLIIAVFTAYSRVYISQHFLVDICVGSLTGIFFGLLSLWIINQRKAAWLDLSLLTLKQD